ncbi:hypothetical protein AMJ74_00185 [candidate division WOR_3 bacterium SM1_77]|uniref:Translocation and assembly module TamB C-terminal domain-containing protein n=1 Tax=candidate division WOR_3 bacterium SM1_77 TaxID=1703778 RepID=A0A0S8K215_UNCW3|nr:MAG: hypothetical protein AMJ74_00185 [candidate division WOR_3 bacterium SM1_77]
MKKTVLAPIILMGLFLIIFIIGGMPFFHSFVKGKLEGVIEDEINVLAHIGSIRGNIFYSVELVDVNIDSTVTLERLKISYNILKLLFKEIDINTLLIDGLKVNVRQMQTLIHSIEKQEAKPEREKATPFKIRIRQLSVMNSGIFDFLDSRDINAMFDIKGELLASTLVIDTLTVRIDESYVFVRGEVPLGEDGELDLYYNMRIMLEELPVDDLQGAVVGHGNLRGKTSSPRIENYSNIDIIYRENKIGGIVELQWQTPMLDSIRLNAKIDAMMPSIQDDTNHKDRWKAVLNIREQDLLFNVNSSYGNIELTGSLSGHMENPDLNTTITGKIRYMDFRPQMKGKIIYENSQLVLKDFSISSPDLLMQCDASLSVVQPQDISGSFLIRCDDLELINNLVKTPQPIDGKLTIGAEVKGTVSRPVITSKAKIENAHVYTETITDAEFSVVFKDSIIYLEPSVVSSSRGTINLTGQYGLADSLFSVHIFTDDLVIISPEIFNGDTFCIDGHIGFDINFSGSILNPSGKGAVLFKNFVFDTVVFDDYSLEYVFKDSIVNANFSNDSRTFDLAVEAGLYTPFIFRTELTLHHFDLKRYIPVDEGHITARMSAYGYAEMLESINGDLRIDTIYLSMQQSNIQNEDVVRISVDQGFVNIVSCVFMIHDQRLVLQGKLPIEPENNQVDLSLRIPKADISHLVMALPDAPQINGFLFADVDLKGSFKKPQINGQLILENIGYSMPDIKLDSVYSIIQFQNSHISIEHFKGRVNQGSFNIGGFADVSGGKISSLNLDVACENIHIKHKDFGSAVLSSAIHTAAQRDSFKINGEVVINKAVYDIPFDLEMILKMLTQVNREPPEQSEIVKRIYCDIGITSPRGVKVINNVADVNIDLDLQIKGYLSKINVYGTATTSEKGTIKYLGKQFEIIHAVIQFDDPYKINPILDIEASSIVSTADGDYEIFMYVQGPVDRWRLELTSNPPIPEQDIISLLVLGRRRPVSGVMIQVKDLGLDGAARDYAEGLVRGTIERTAEQTLGLEKFTITGDLLDSKSLDINIEKRVAKKLTLIYGSGIESWELRRVGINYDVTDNISIFTLHDQENMNSSMDLDFHFNIK